MKLIILLSIIVLSIISAYPLLGCCTGGCGGCCGEDDLSNDLDSDGSYGQERIPHSLGYTQQQQQQNQRPAGICDSDTTNSVSVTATRESSEAGYVYSYSFTIRACRSMVGYTATFNGPISKMADQGAAPQSKETSRSDSFTDSRKYNTFCVNTGDSSIGNKCVPLD